MHVCIADNSNLIDPVSRAVCCAADKKRIRIVVLKCETAVRIWESRHCAQADPRVVIAKREDYFRRIRSHAVCYGPKRRMTCSNLRCFSNRSRFTESRGQSSYRRSCPHGKRANDGHTCEEQSGRKFVEVRFHRFFWVLSFCFLRPCDASFFGSRTNVFLLGQAETAAKTRHVFVALQQTRTQFFQRFSGQTPVESTRPKTIARLRCRLTSTSKAAASRSLTA